MTFEEKCDTLSILSPHALLADGFEDALVGFVRAKHKSEILALYDSELCIEILMKEHDMDEEEALDYFGYNVTSAYMGPTTPVFTYLFPEEEEEKMVSCADGDFEPEHVTYFEEGNEC
jgi:hypothetical protein